MMNGQNIRESSNIAAWTFTAGETQLCVMDFCVTEISFQKYINHKV
jgi:hypothetical protein